MTKTRYTPHALERETRRVLRRLAEGQAYAQALEPRGFGLYVARNGFARPVLTFDDDVARALTGEGLTSAPPRLEITPEGRAYLARAQAGEDAFQAQHRDMGTRSIADESGRVETHAVNTRESTLAWLASRKGADGHPLISDLQYEAGERLRTDYTRGQLMARVTVDWQMPFSDGGSGSDRLTLGESAMAARRRVGDALKAVGPGLNDILVEVCCHLKGLEDAERAFNWPPRTGKVVLRIALERLAAHYGLKCTAVRSSKLTSWSAESAS